MKQWFYIMVLVVIPTQTFAQESEPIAKANFRKAIAAAGGEARFVTLKAPTMWMETGTYFGMGDGIPFMAQLASYWPKRWYRQLIEGQFALGIAGDQVTAFAANDTVGQKLTGEMQKAALHQGRIAWARLLYPLREDDYTLLDAPGVDVDGQPTVGIKAVHESGSEILLYFDQHTFLLAKTQTQVFAQEYGKEVKSETFYSDHKSFGGVKLPSKYKILYEGKLFVEGETVAIKTHATIDPTWFGTDGPARVR